MKRKTMTVRLHTAEPSFPTEHEATYSGYEPVSVLFYERPDGTLSRQREIAFPECMAGWQYITHLSASGEDGAFFAVPLGGRFCVALGAQPIAGKISSASASPQDHGTGK